MAKESRMTALGFELPDRELHDAVGASHLLRQEGVAATVLAFVCNHCPYVKLVEDAFGWVASDFAGRGVRTVAVVSNDLSTHPQDGPEGMVEQATRAGWNFPYLIDSDQSLAVECGAACTPDIFVFGPDHTLMYRGAFDDANPSNGLTPDGARLRDALEHILAGSFPPEPHRPSMGCGIKWIPGMEPASY
jgi:hypothetical protein